MPPLSLDSVIKKRGYFLSLFRFNRLAAAYDRYAAAVMLPLPQMNDCPARQGLDAAVIDALGLDAEEIGSIRRQLAMEPSVTGKRYAGLGR